ncbi:RraA family protein [Streptomyces sp. CA-278952]|uniref:RraA family protein n=1 Tax=Streptomyces sp. CA-278952 TaxID=2980556 RepID=UPI0023688106|nr:RraA family protein [Streptomyces sp. CA-278952]WDG29806.1 RraA family protein [Streptomyces sp. CA-278952]
MFIKAPTDNIEIAPPWPRADLDEVKKLAQYPVALIGDAQSRLGMMASPIRPVTPSPRLAGTVLPIHAREGDNLAIHRALDDALPGDILVINANAETNRAVFGDILGEICLAKGVTGIVVDGSIRDVDELAGQGLAVYARGISPAGPWKNGPGRIGFPVACGNIVCNPGDAIIGDNDGIVVIPQHALSDTIERTEAQERTEQKMRDAIHAAV